MGKLILCPRCGRKVMTYDGKGTIEMKKKCSKCNKLVTYSPKANKTKLSDIPVRSSSSGKRFY